MRVSERGPCSREELPSCHPLYDPSLMFLAWRDGRYQQHRWTGTGGEVLYEVEPGPMSVLAP